MFENIGTLLTNPDRFFDRRGRDPSLREPLLVVLLIAIISAISGAVTIYQFVDAVPSEVQIFLLIGGVIGVVIGAVAPFIGWLLYALAFHVITYFFDGEGEFRDTFALTGWGYAPRVAYAIIALVMTVYLTQTMGTPSDVAGFQTYSAELQSQLVYQVLNAGSILFLLWSAYIWIPAVQRARNVTKRQATITVAIPVAFGILLTVIGMVISGAV